MLTTMHRAWSYARLREAQSVSEKAFSEHRLRFYAGIHMEGLRMIRKFVFGCLAAASLSGCIAGFVAPSTQGKGWVVVAGLFNQHMYLCDATGGKPVCKEQPEQ